MNSPKKYVLVGTGSRGRFYLNGIMNMKGTAIISAVCDSNPGRVEAAIRLLREKYNVTVKGYPADQFDRMLEEIKPDGVIVTTMDRYHDEYICRSMEAGYDVITEKPLTIDEVKCRRIIETQRKTGRKCTVTFNYRFSPPRTQIKDLLMSGIIGEILSVDFQWLLDTKHGADYYRRWHRRKENSGGLLVHKATHHFDLVNWWLDTVPEEVYAVGQRRFYVPATAEALGLQNRGERCLGCPESSKCPFYVDIRKGEEWPTLYLQCEKYDGYYRERCVFSEEINIEDTMELIVQYRNGVKMSYSLNSFSPWEGYIISFNGTKGRLEHKCQESVYMSGDGSVPGELKPEGTWIHVYPHWKPPYSVQVWTGKGGHGGGDPLMLRYIFDPENQPSDKYNRTADLRAGVYSIIAGIAGNISIRTGKTVKIADLIPEI